MIIFAALQRGFLGLRGGERCLTVGSYASHGIVCRYLPTANRSCVHVVLCLNLRCSRHKCKFTIITFGPVTTSIFRFFFSPNYFLPCGDRREVLQQHSSISRIMNSLACCLPPSQINTMVRSANVWIYVDIKMDIHVVIADDNSSVNLFQLNPSLLYNTNQAEHHAKLIPIYPSVSHWWSTEQRLHIPAARCWRTFQISSNGVLSWFVLASLS